MEMYLLNSRSAEYLLDNTDVEIDSDAERLVDMLDFLSRAVKIGVTRSEVYNQGFCQTDIENIMLLGSFKSEF